MNNRLKIGLYPVHNLEYRTTIRLIIKIGSMDEEIAGLAHFVEHMQLAFDRMGLLEQHEKFTICGKTHLEYTMYEFNCCGDSESMNIVFDIMRNILNGRYLIPNFIEIIRKDILDELYRKNLTSQSIQDFVILTNKKELPIGNAETICKITFKDIQKFFKEKYCKAPVYICIAGNYIEKDIKNFVQRKFWNQHQVNTIETKCCYNNMVNVIERKRKVSFYFPLYSEQLENLKGRVTTDLFTILMEHYLEKFFNRIFEKQITIESSIIRYAMNWQYLKFDINNMENTNINYFWELFSRFVNTEFNPIAILEVIEQYIRYMSERCSIYNEDALVELTNYFLYGNVIFEREKYLEILTKIEIKDVKEIFGKLLSSKCKIFYIDS